jgi:2-oxoglutarate ferredoxin oxidoreductase subunit alpha
MTGGEIKMNDTDKKTRSILNILIGGEAGQGLVTIGQILAKSLVRSGYSIVVTQSYQSRIRGGHNTFSIRVGSGEVIAPQESVDLLVALDKDTVLLHRRDLTPDGLILLDGALDIGGDSALKVPFKELANAHVTSRHKLPAISNRSRRLMMNGNEAIALGAISAGLRFYSFYPMTPSTSTSLTLAGQARRMGLIVEQAEDEIAAINMAIGASFAGVRCGGCPATGSGHWPAYTD